MAYAKFNTKEFLAEGTEEKLNVSNFSDFSKSKDAEIDKVASATADAPNAKAANPAKAAPTNQQVESTQPTPIPLHAYRVDGTRRCRFCRHVLSVIDLEDTCVRCVRVLKGPTANFDLMTEDEPHLRGLALIAVDRRRYPAMHLPDGRQVGAGIEGWGPVLRGMDEADLRNLLAFLEGAT